MNFNEIDEARKAAALVLAQKGEKRGRKRKNSVISQDEAVAESKPAGNIAKARKGSIAETTDAKEGQDLRVGRWTNDEMAFCDKLIQCFKDGSLPVNEGIKLNDFLASILKSKQSRLTKKMKVSSKVS